MTPAISSHIAHSVNDPVDFFVTHFHCQSCSNIVPSVKAPLVLLNYFSRFQLKFLYDIIKGTKFWSDAMRHYSVVAESKYVILQTTNNESANVFTLKVKFKLKVRLYPQGCSQKTYSGRCAKSPGGAQNPWEMLRTVHTFSVMKIGCSHCCFYI